MKTDILRHINRIIEQESKTSTYKFALLRGLIEIIQENSPYIRIDLQRGIAEFRMGLMIEKWLIYYFIIFDSEVEIPQIHKGRKLAFESELKELIKLYKDKNGISGLYHDLRGRGIPENHKSTFLILARKLKDTISGQPMRYLGTSVTGKEYGLFNYSSVIPDYLPTTVDYHYLAHKYGTFSISLDYYEAFRLMGSLISGQDSLLFKWARFSSDVTGGELQVARVIQEVLKGPITERDATDSRSHFTSLSRNGQPIECVWTGRLLSRFDLDHIIPFSIWKNNDLWNLLPSSVQINNAKRDRIPNPELIRSRETSVRFYWDLIYKAYPERFEREVSAALTAGIKDRNPVEQLAQTCHYLIHERGFRSWNG